jgi:hypothetical protein
MITWGPKVLSPSLRGPKPVTRGSMPLTTGLPDGPPTDDGAERMTMSTQARKETALAQPRVRVGTKGGANRRPTTAATRTEQPHIKMIALGGEPSGPGSSTAPLRAS